MPVRAPAKASTVSPQGPLAAYASLVSRLERREPVDLGVSDLADQAARVWREADQESGFVTFEVSTRRFRPADGSGSPIGDLLFDPAAGEPSGTADGVNRRLFNRVVVAIMRAYRRAGAAPATAHAYYY
jgi:hypothetical protein